MVTPVPSSSEENWTSLETPKPPVHKGAVGVMKQPSDHVPSTRGVFKTESHTLRKPQNTCKYKCRMCKERVNSAHELTEHHQTVHGIIYCSVCNKAFNNLISLACHEY